MSRRDSNLNIRDTKYPGLMNLDLLSSESYPDVLSGNQSHNDGPLPFGMVEGETELTTDSKINPTKSRKAKSNSMDDSSSRQRGRPRLNTKDENAAEVSFHSLLRFNGSLPVCGTRTLGM